MKFWAFVWACALSVPAARGVETYAVDLAQYNLKLPATADAELQRVFTNAIFYKIPQAMQHWVPPERMERLNQDRPYLWAVYRKAVFGELNSNVKFPWETTLGLNSTFKDKDTPYRTVDFLSLPQLNGKPVPVLVLNGAPVRWIFPPGTTVGEMLYVTYEGEHYVQEVRTRRKAEDQTEWLPRVYRPVKDQREFARLTGLPPDYTPAKKYQFFRNPQEDEVFKMEGFVDRLPNLLPDVIKRLLNRPFQDVTDENWAPAADQDFHILPKDYCLSLLSVDNVTCANCHRQTQITTHNLIPKEPLIRRNPDKDTSIRGCDAVFTWHPFDSDTLREDVDDKRQLRFRETDLQKQTIRVVPERDTVPGYKLTKFVQESLRPYELPRNLNYLHNAQLNARPEEEPWMRAGIPSSK